MKKRSFLSTFFSSKPVVWFFALQLRILTQLLFLTLRFEIPKKNEMKPLILALWHSDLLLLAPIIRKVFGVPKLSILISKSKDGNIPSAYAETFRGVQVIRVGHLARPQALLESLQALSSGRMVLITPDGPRGPAKTIKPGVIFCAQKSGAPIVPISWSASYCFELSSWDRFRIPYPFSKIKIEVGEEIFLKPHQTVKEAEKELISVMQNSL